MIGNEHHDRPEVPSGTSGADLSASAADRSAFAADRCAAEAERLFTRYTSARGSRRPPVNVHEIAAWLGYRVVLLREAPDECSALVSLPEHLIGVNALHHPRRRRFSVAHELGHIVLGHPPESRCTPGAIGAFNTEADRFASVLLMPERWILRALARNLPVAAVAGAFDVSEEAARRRMAVVGTGV